MSDIIFAISYIRKKQKANRRNTAYIAWVIYGKEIKGSVQEPMELGRGKTACRPEIKTCGNAASICCRAKPFGYSRAAL